MVWLVRWFGWLDGLVSLMVRLVGWFGWLDGLAVWMVWLVGLFGWLDGFGWLVWLARWFGLLDGLVGFVDYLLGIPGLLGVLVLLPCAYTVGGGADFPNSLLQENVYTVLYEQNQRQITKENYFLVSKILLRHILYKYKKILIRARAWIRILIRARAWIRICLK